MLLNDQTKLDGVAEMAKSDSERAYLILRQAILDNEIKPQERIVETVYAKKLNMSRTPIREALRRLEQDELVEYANSKGVTVRALPTNEEIQEIYSIRALLQMMSVQSTVDNITDEELLEMQQALAACDLALENGDDAAYLDEQDRFNYLLLRSSHMPVLFKLLMQMERYNPITSVASTGKYGANYSNLREVAVPVARQKEAQLEHRRIYDALLARDKDALAEALKVHLENTKGICLTNCEDIRIGKIEDSVGVLSDSKDRKEAQKRPQRAHPAEEAGERPCILILNGPNMNLLGSRENIYGTATYDEMCAGLLEIADEYDVDLVFYQSNHEGYLVDKLHELRDSVVGVVINPAGYTFTGYAIRDAISACSHRAVEVHLTNMFNREDFRSRSVIAQVSDAYIAGMGIYGYEMALRFLCSTQVNKV